MDLSHVPNQLGTAVLKTSNGQVLQATGQLDGLEANKILSNIYSMMKVRSSIIFYVVAQIIKLLLLLMCHLLTSSPFVITGSTHCC